MSIRLIGGFCGLLMSALVGGCAPQSPYLAGYRYAPAPALVDVFRKGADSQQPPLSVMVSVIGIRRGGSTADAPPAIEVRMRFENNGQAKVSFDPSTLNLVSGTLQPFLQPEVHGPKPLQLAPGQNQTISAFFPFPRGAGPRTMGLDSLRLRWQVQVDNQVIPQTAYFERASPLYYEVD
ncbi:MAG TPA: hypothetical protein VG326_10430 [Tepidisphaeraceae bacterium]|jgi:hypothetical protein|nr:hypothetical protein [Tepidisphaeraceae bacterium]